MEENMVMDGDEQAVPQEKLYSLNAVMLATFLGGPMAGGYLLYKNYASLGETEGGKSIIIWAILTTYLLIGSLLALPEHIIDKLPNFLIPWISAGIAYFVAKMLQGEVLVEHKEQGGVFYSKWRACLVALVCVVVTVLMLLPLAFILPG